jgi:hypothetical protein
VRSELWSASVLKAYHGEAQRRDGNGTNSEADGREITIVYEVESSNRQVVIRPVTAYEVED